MTHTAGCRTIELFDPQTDLPLPVLILYPATGPEHPAPLGPYTLDIALNAPTAPGPFPLVVISHGSGGSHLAYRTLATHLARHGYAVALPEHPGNNRNNNHLADTAANLANRPRHIRQVLDWAFASDQFGPCLQPATAAVIGHSLGGYTALSTAGGRPIAFARETPDQQPRPIDVTPAPRVKALVLLAPATPWFMAPGALAGVHVPILLWTAEHDPHTSAWHAELVKQGLPATTPLEHRIAANAGHFSFLSPFPASMTNPAFPPSQDPPGFDRARFHSELNAEVLEFLRRVTPPPPSRYDIP